MAEKKKSFVMEIGDLQNDRREVTFAYGNHNQIVVAYNPGALTLEDIERDPGDNRERISGQLASWLLEWPIVQHGEPLAISQETLLALPAGFVLALYQAVTRDVLPAKN